MFLSFAGPAAHAQLLIEVEEPGPTIFPVSRLEIVYAREHPDQPGLASLVPVRVELRPTDEGWTAPEPGAAAETVEIGGPRSPTVRLDASALALTLRALVSAIHDTGVFGVDVRPASEDIDLETETDLRPEGQDALRIVVSIGRIGLVRTIAVGDRVTDDWRIDNPIHDEIREHSPLQATGGIDDDATDLLDRRALEDYLYRLNRYPGRRVEAALSPDEEPGSVVLDYRIAESKPWYVYGQASNTGTKRTSTWQYRLGAVQRQLTDNDDTLSVEYLNGGADVNGIRAEYDAPFFGPDRPDWMKQKAGDPGWLDWLQRDKIPWWGIDRLRWSVDFSFGRFEAGREPINGIANDAVISEQIQGGGRLSYEIFQYKNFFIDVFTGLQIQNLRVTNKTLPDVATGNAILVLPRVGFGVQQISAISNLTGDFAVQGQINDLSADEREKLGRNDVANRYAKLQFLLGYSTYLEPLLFPKAFNDPETRLSSTLAHELALAARGQYAFDYRLIPQANQVVGGLYSVRGYEQSQAVGDSVVIGTLEYRFHVPRALPMMREPLNVPVLGDFRIAPQQAYGRPDWDFTLSAFVDVGRTIRNSNGFLNGTLENDETLLGVGFGAELQVRSNLRARVDWATRLRATPQDHSGKYLSFGEKSEVYFLFSILY